MWPYALMHQLTHGRDRRFAISEDYTRFYDERTPGSLMRLWAGYMEPPGKHGGRVLAFTDYSLNETHRFGHCVISLYRASAEILEVIKLVSPRSWVQIWPAVGTSEWPPAERLPTGRVDPLFAGLPVRPSSS